MLSVIIPVFNAEKFITKAVTSAVSQDEVREIIIIEDNSTDNSYEICKKLENEHVDIVKLFQHVDGKNHGAGASRNLGIEKSKCEFIAFLDADDYYLPCRFRRDIEIFCDNPNIDGVYNALGNHYYIAGNYNNNNLTTIRCLISPENLFEEMSPIGTNGYFSCDALTVRRTIFDKVGFFNTDLELSQDTHMWIKMAAKAVLVSGIIDKPVAMRGVHTGNRINNKHKLDYYRPLLFLSLLEWAKENNIKAERKKILLNYAYKFYRKSIYSHSCSLIEKKIKLFIFFVYHGLRNIYFLAT